jgi:aminoglycoside 3-N-acetyltransferase
MYAQFQDVMNDLDLKKGDILLVSSDVIRLIDTIKNNKGVSDLNIIINTLQSILGDEGTLLFPTYNWDFCKGMPFDYYKTPSRTGLLSKIALKRNDFKRSKHPIYSFAVWGKYQGLLCSLENTDSFGLDSPFDFLFKQSGKNLMIDVDYANCFTFLHYVEESVGVSYRYIKNFQSVYIDEHQESKERNFSMYVRNLELHAEGTGNPMGVILEKKGISKRTMLNDIPLALVDLRLAYDAIKDDIVNNRAKNIATYQGQ